ncbi:MAG: hypothetical protein A2312_01215 [Candidatus Staskawiczbacteria bacterium RIFOXYB2_FULL_32_9]|uniref:Gram-positive cocci surface proteins LPxTG domain-containing protein n=1 Tax=Candidatus Staskawiczbacteria bacterium RIFOXYD1_FULL_32_13 TaxID=1802234 RepID=A0A1G2JRL3_9BACT|nr:MAG: hypothetical protein UR22_C0003G0028 [Parcubacteria group bacterium GW2011_GWC2_32_10]OGZ78363.1 MAG: hypothetical protein A2360_03525 [Candidatus Staskawiczbacteria bacterium RIFOXYB1_FULL_32_11]OGZ80735.1 MAG: hypothetical protein A2256_02015 [Candidatus Staskawiczbacteria bacterium RIFOXYA2_FULL_32_7]OGZ81336.1 MAG: hypothetical protein A2312_01215 [Candidatus Staskawiczbacteria bacterium RIFOXYB2_FULL_32_9]OGZ86725.1 MAG: hypothetical protein A2463_03760 [Candidatus Staskawiczbacter
MKNKLNKFLSITLFLTFTVFIAQNSFASEITGTLTTGENPSQNTNNTNETNNFQILNGQVTNPSNSQVGSTQNNMMDNFISNLLGKSDNPGIMLEGILIGVLLTFFIGLIIFMLIRLIKKSYKNNINLS